VFAVRIEPELRIALEHEAERRCVNRSVLVREALLRVVDPGVLKEATRRERLRALQRTVAVDEERLRAALKIPEDRADRPVGVADVPAGARTRHLRASR
jgi:hypothetical protein